MTPESSVLGANSEVLGHPFVEDFIIVDVFSGGETSKIALLDVIRSGRLKSRAVKPL